MISCVNRKFLVFIRNRIIIMEMKTMGIINLKSEVKKVIII